MTNALIRVGRGRGLTLVAVGLVLALVVTAVVVLVNATSGTRITAYFSQAPGLYSGDQVRILGVQAGTVDEITPLPDQVRVDMTVDAGQPVPADAQAVIIAASLVSGRYVQLAPVYRGGPQMADGATIPIQRTSVPVEWDEFKDQVTRLSTDLGPQLDGDTRGALNDFLDVAAANLDGQGPTINSTITQLSRAVTTVSDGREDLFGTIRNLQLVVTALRESDQDVDLFNRQLADVSAVLDFNREELAVALATFDQVVPEIQSFIAENREDLDDAVVDLTRVTDNLRDNRQDLADLLQKAPTAFANLSNIYDQGSGTLTGVLALTNFADPAQFFCSIFFGAASTQTGGDFGDVEGAFNLCRTALGPLGQILAQESIPLNIPSIFGAQPATTPGGQAGLPLVPLPGGN